MAVARDLQKTLAALQRIGILLQSDSKLPSVVGLVAGQPVGGSWWSHPRSHDIHAVLTRLADEPDVLSAKLVSGKVTFVHRRLWPALYAVGQSGEPWQTKGLSSASRKLWQEVEARGQVRTDKLVGAAWRARVSPGDAARQLEQRLLVYGREVHTDSGAHAKQLESWEAWARRVELAELTVHPRAAKRLFDRIVQRLNGRHGGRGTLPW